jgi:hypothetical protein
MKPPQEGGGGGFGWARPWYASGGATILWAGLVAGVLDIVYVIVFYRFRGVGPQPILQGIAAGLIGRDAVTKFGMAAAALGLVLHFMIALGAAATFYGASRKLRVLVTRPITMGILYGVAVWFFMNLVVLPLSATPPKTFPSPVWPFILIAHIFCVGLPIAGIVSWRDRKFGARG